MSLYVPRHFGNQSQDDALKVIRDWPFATLITTSACGEPHITHLPLLLLEEGQLTGHMARANAHWQAFGQGHTVAVFQGPHAYISPLWYDDPAANVPTWNFAVVHVHGQPQLVEDAARKLAIVDASSAVFETSEHPWQRQLQPAKQEAMLNNIVAFHLPMTRLDAQFKMNQNKTDADRAKVVAALRATAQPEAAAVADLIQHLAPPHETR